MNAIKNTLRGFLLTLSTFVLSLAALAQEKTDINVDVNKGSSGNWYTQPWVWIVGGAIFILLLVALLRGNRSSD